MPNYTTTLRLEKPLQSENYDIDIFNSNADLIDSAIQNIKDEISGLSEEYVLATKVKMTDGTIAEYVISKNTADIKNVTSNILTLQTDVLNMNSSIKTVQSGLTSANSNIKTLPNDYDLVLIQLGDNVNTDEKNEVFKTSCRTLLSEVRRYMPNALVCWVGAWYTNATKQENMSKSCLATGSKFIDISDLAVVENKGNVGDLITYPDGRVEAITSTGVASHPNSKGMKAIADRIISTIF